MFTEILQDKRKEINPKFKLEDLFKAADRTVFFLDSNAINWSYEFYTNTYLINSVIPTYHINKGPERFNGAFRKNSELSMPGK